MSEISDGKMMEVAYLRDELHREQAARKVAERVFEGIYALPWGYAGDSIDMAEAGLAEMKRILEAE